MGQWPLRCDVYNESDMTGMTEHRRHFWSDY